MRQAQIYRKNVLAGILTEDGGEYRFCYDEAYLKRAKPSLFELCHGVGSSTEGQT